MTRLSAIWGCCRAIVLGSVVCLLHACAPSPLAQADFVVTIPPLQFIVQELTGDAATVASILPPGSSPHTYELRPSTARLLENARAVFYVDDSIDGWAARLAPGKIHAVFDLVPEDLRREFHVAHDHGETESAAEPHTINAHFWSDPVVVKAIVPRLVDTLSQSDPDNADIYATNATRFIGELDELDAEFKAAPAPVGGYALVAFHPSWCYFFERYGIKVGAYVEPFPGKEPTPQTIQQLKQDLTGAKRCIVLSEVQLPAKSAEVLAETLGAQVAVIDPLGGQGDRTTYAGLLRYNAARIRESLQ
ncbi:MAG: zinc ABC transporter substrate-binding protein [Candidatus Hydrogenedentes bacterium]|nr:zinc ABC transporter substrate-binding protein [Candidatus Hydrogenedentota bacterium]